MPRKTRNQFVGNHTRVRIPPTAPKKSWNLLGFKAFFFFLPFILVLLPILVLIPILVPPLILPLTENESNIYTDPKAVSSEYSENKILRTLGRLPAYIPENIAVYDPSRTLQWHPSAHKAAVRCRHVRSGRSGPILPPYSRCVPIMFPSYSRRVPSIFRTIPEPSIQSSIRSVNVTRQIG